MRIVHESWLVKTVYDGGGNIGDMFSNFVILLSANVKVGWDEYHEPTDARERSKCQLKRSSAKHCHSNNCLRHKRPGEHADMHTVPTHAE